MDTDAAIDLLLHGNQLKRTARTGWVQRGISQAEDVAAHSYGVVLTTLVLAQLVEEPIDLGRALAIAAVHDLPEGLTTDIPAPAWRFLPAGSKRTAEQAAMARILHGSEKAEQLMSLWEELQQDKTHEARLVHDADKIDMLLQALVYEEQTGNQRLAEFWQKPYSFNFAPAQAIYEALHARRP